MSGITHKTRTVMGVGGGSVALISVILAIVLQSDLIMLGFALGWFNLLGAAVLNDKTKTSISSYSRPTKITTGRFKGKMLMAEMDVEDLERDYLHSSVEAEIDKINRMTYITGMGISSCGSPLAEHTIERLREALNPWCGDCADRHRVDDHDAYIQKKIRERKDALAIEQAKEERRLREMRQRDEYEDSLKDIERKWDTGAPYRRAYSLSYLKSRY